MSAPARERSAPTGRPFQGASSTPDADDSTAEVVELWDPQAIAGRAFAKYGPRSHSIICEWLSLIDYAEHGPAFGPDARIPDAFIERAAANVPECRRLIAEARERIRKAQGDRP